MLTAGAGGGLLDVLTLVLGGGGGFGAELCEDGAPALELCETLAGADGVRDAVGLPAGVLCARR